MMCTMSWANELYMEQSGDSSTITITQDGASNEIGKQLLPVFIGGGSNTVSIEQIGAGNQLEFTVNGAATSMTIEQHGGNNIGTVTCGTTASASCSGSTIWQLITGDDNNIRQILDAGGNHISKITVTGDTNIVSHNSTNTGAVNMQYTVTGNTNTISVITEGTTVKTLNATTTGNNNTVNIVQTN